MPVGAMRVPQKKENKGSQKWIRILVNKCPEILNAYIRCKIPSLSERDIIWLSPLEREGFKEYQDDAFLEKIGLQELTGELSDFWPKNGPVWDGLGKTSNETGETAFFLVEAKAHVSELITKCGAKDEFSLYTISKALDETQRWLNCRNPKIDWKSGFYQYANRLAHLYFLRERNREAYLVFLYFVGDPTHISTSREAWNSALALQKKLLGLSADCLTGKAINLYHRHRGYQGSLTADC
jgi:hypothetical protein